MICAISVMMTLNLAAQFPLAGYVVEEVPMSSEVQQKIEAELGETGVKCWRVYLCLEDPNWELQSIHGNDEFPWEFLPTNDIYQAAAGGGPIAANINPQFFQLAPEIEYDSWFTIGKDDHTSQANQLSGKIDPFEAFETEGTFVVNDDLGSSLFGVWMPPNSQGLPDENHKLLIGQFTTAGTINTKFNFQFRKLNPDGSIITPVEAVNINGFEIEVSKSSGLRKCPK